jgi:hypothetical protein
MDETSSARALVEQRYCANLLRAAPDIAPATLGLMCDEVFPDIRILETITADIVCRQNSRLK